MQKKRYDEEGGLARLRAKCAVGAWVLCGAAGMLTSWYGDTSLNVLFAFVGGIVAALVAMGVGGAAGMAARWLMQRSGRQEEDEAGTYAEEGDTVGAMALGSLVGGFLGVVAAAVLGRLEAALWGAAFGVALGAAVAGAFLDLFTLLLHMLAQDRALHDEEAKQRRRDKRRGRS